MKLTKLFKKFAAYTKIDLLDSSGNRLLPVSVVRDFEIKDIQKYKVQQIIAFSQEPGIVTIYVEVSKNANN